MQLCCLPEQGVTLSAAVDSVSGLALLYFSMSSLLLNPFTDDGVKTKPEGNSFSSLLVIKYRYIGTD